MLVKKTKVNIEKIMPQSLIISGENLSNETKIIVSGIEKVQEGQKVEVNNELN